MLITEVTGGAHGIALADVKEHLLFPASVDAQDDLITQKVNAAVRMIENAGSRLVLRAETVFKMQMKSWPKGDLIKLDRFPVTALTSVKYYTETANTLTTLVNDTDYRFISEVPGFEMITDVPDLYDREYPIEVVFEAGFATIPPEILDAVYLIVGALFQNREDDARKHALSVAEMIVYQYRAPEYFA